MDKIMFNEYIDKAVQYAQCEQIEDGTYFGRIPGFKGVWANKPTEQELREVLEGWILLNIADHTPLPIVDGMTLEVGKLV
jgi:predicted RNase H-like HicB family nuclease